MLKMTQERNINIKITEVQVWYLTGMTKKFKLNFKATFLMYSKLFYFKKSGQVEIFILEMKYSPKEKWDEW